jgi:hypothetical protein
MTTTKKRVSLYLASDQALEALFDALRELAPLDKRGKISRSTAAEAAVNLALADLRENGRASAIYRSMVESP